MKTLSKLSLAVAGAAAMGSVATVFNADEAYAASLYGSISFSNSLSGVNPGVNPGTDTFNLGAPNLGTTTGDFAGVTITSLISSFTIDLVDPFDKDPSGDGITQGLYSFAEISDFFTLSNGFTFALDAGQLVRTRFQNKSFVSIGGLAPLSGRFIDSSGEVAGFGSLSFTGVPNGSGTYGVSITTEEIPTPFLLPGLLGLGVAALRRKQEESAEADT